jgi:CheY-like chemotaxis protein
MCKKSILVVDDEENIRHALKRWFQSCGYEVAIADDGDVAVELCRETSFDAVTMDLEMPRMNGRRAIEAIREFAPELPIIVLSGYCNDPSDPALKQANKIMLKPVSLTEIEQTVREAIQESTSEN